jgi:cytoskeletal protein CcmA (bactofilin family)
MATRIGTVAAPSPDDRTIIGGSVVVKGSLTGDEDLHVLGRVEGSIELQRTLVVADSGIVKAEVHVKNAIVSGVVVGNIHASDSVEITKGGRMVGDIAAPRVILVDGAAFRGSIDMGDIENMPARLPSEPRARPTPVATSSRAAASSSRPTVAPRRTEIPRPTQAPAREAPAPAPIEARAESAPTVSSPPMEPPAAKGLPHKAQKTRVVVKRK